MIQIDMSLYIQVCLPVDNAFAIDKLQNSVDLVARKLSVNVETELDNIEAKYLRGLLGSKRNHLSFWITSSNSEKDATLLWLEARECALRFLETEPSYNSLSVDDVHFSIEYFDELRNSRLGRFFWVLLEMCPNGGVWIADGGPDDVVKEYHFDQCRKEIMKTMVLNWDVLPNMTYIWNEVV